MQGTHCDIPAGRQSIDSPPRLPRIRFSLMWHDLAQQSGESRWLQTASTPSSLWTKAFRISKTPLPCRLPNLTVHHPKQNVPVLWWRSVGSTHTTSVMETLIDEIARITKQDLVAYRMRLFADKHPRHRAALQLAMDKSGYGK